ncbi:phosphoadenosine phosphosulfate reductase domain-containing protein [Pseudochrobactrum asaccharolyticum]|uniref:phosphoadenosine phosphosulfate reductase domain-containing protein n=1 Tax=Pseudochrobactrum asaccharolyticum TaxID=354351 RepID=UPI0040416EBB
MVTILDTISKTKNETLKTTGAPIKFVIFSSYGNDSIALIKWASEQQLDGVAVVFTDTQWMSDGWPERVEKAEAWVRSLGFTPYRTTSIGFRQLARDKKGFPTQRYQWCSYVLKIQPGMRWLAEHDPEARAVCLVGVRREESQDRKNFPAYLVKSENHGGRTMIAPFADLTEAERNLLIEKADWQVLPHRSRECRCINSNRNDMKNFTESDWQEIAAIEAEVGKNMFRPQRHMGATGALEVKKWALSPRGKYVAPEKMDDAVELEDAPEEEDFLGVRGSCDTFGECGS